jgi:hypothetical protein
VSVTYDAGALVAVDRGDMRMRSRHEDLLDANLTPVAPGRHSLAPGDVVHAWRDLLHGDPSTSAKRFRPQC